MFSAQKAAMWCAGRRLPIPILRVNELVHMEKSRSNTQNLFAYIQFVRTQGFLAKLIRDLNAKWGRLIKHGKRNTRRSKYLPFWSDAFFCIHARYQRRGKIRVMYDIASNWFQILLSRAARTGGLLRLAHRLLVNFHPFWIS